MPLTVDIALHQMEPVLTELDNEQLDALISALSKRMSEPQKTLTMLLLEQTETYVEHTYHFNTTLEYDAYQQCLIDHGGYPDPTHHEDDLLPEEELELRCAYMEHDSFSNDDDPDWACR